VDLHHEILDDGPIKTTVGTIAGWVVGSLGAKRSSFGSTTMRHEA
jgi:hypothetical protein